MMCEGEAMTEYFCEHCGWHFSAQLTRSAEACPHCRVGKLTEVESGKQVPVERFLPYSVSSEEFRTRVAEFSRSIPFSPADLTPDLLFRRAEHIFFPRYLVDAGVRAEWQAEMGYNYEVVSHQEILEGGRWKTVERKETRKRMESRVGRLVRHYENVPAPALEDDVALRGKLGDYSTQNSESIEDKTIDPWIRLPERTFDDAWSDAVGLFQRRAADECRQAAEADHVGSFSWQAEFNEKNWTLLLLPIITSYYRDDTGQVCRVLLNGQTGTIFGDRRASELRARKLAVTLGIIAAALLAGSVVTGLMTVLVPLLGFLAMILFFGGAACGVGALLPVFVARRFNRRQSGDQ